MDITNKTKKTIKLSAYVTGTAGEVTSQTEIRPGRSMKLSERFNDIYIDEVK